MKNKVAPPFATGSISCITKAFQKQDILDLAAQLEIVTKRGAFYSYKDMRLGQGRENSKDFLRANPELASEIETEIRNAAKVGDIPIMSFTSDSDSEDDQES